MRINANLGCAAVFEFTNSGSMTLKNKFVTNPVSFYGHVITKVGLHQTNKHVLRVNVTPFAPVQVQAFRVIHPQTKKHRRERLL